MKKMNTKKLTTLGVLAACSIVLVAFIHFPIFPAVSFLEYDPADIPILIGTFLFGPVWGVVLTVIVSAIQGFTVSAQSGVYGIVMHVVATSAFSLVAGLIYKHNKTKKGALIAIICGVIAMTAVMYPANLAFTPVYLNAMAGMEMEAAKGMVKSLMPLSFFSTLQKQESTAQLLILFTNASTNFSENLTSHKTKENP